jgi:uncharacterized protein involved in response to NO
MIYGFAAAAVAGFVLTAVPNWTKRPKVEGYRLALLLLLWLVGRIALWSEGWVWLDLLFLPVLTGFVGADILHARHTKGYPVIGILAALILCNGWYHFVDPGEALRAAILVFAALIALLGGRLIPFFSVRDLGLPLIPTPFQQKFQSVTGTVAILLVLVLIPIELIMPGSVVAGWVALGAGTVLLARMWGWGTLRSARVPLVWVLHVGYLWVPVGMFLIGGAHLWDVLPPTAALHALTVGGMGVMIQAIASRASLGHTGRPKMATPLMAVGYLCVIGAALVRVFIPLDSAILMAGLLWCVGYALFTGILWPILTTPRPDGQPG